MTAAEWLWDPVRLSSRQTYIDLIRAYLVDYGSQRDLARALGVSEAYVSYLLLPLTPPAGPAPAHWSVLLSAAGYEVADVFKFAKTPSEMRAQQIAGQLVTGAERRDALVHYIRKARTPSRPEAARPPSLDPDAITRALKMAGDVHHDALHDPAEPVTADSYARVWRHAHALPSRIDPRRYPVAHAQALMFLHDTAQVLGRADLALGFARRALSVLPAVERGTATAYGSTRLRINAFLAEVVSLNTLGLRAEASRTIAHAETLSGFRDEPETWLRSFLEQRLTAMAGLSRTSVYQAERTAELALSLVPSGEVFQAGVKQRLADVYLSRMTTRTMRKAAVLADDLERAADPATGMSPLRRVQILRTLARYRVLLGDKAAAERLIGESLRVTVVANLSHQRSELVREFCLRGAELRRFGGPDIS